MRTCTIFGLILIIGSIPLGAYEAFRSLDAGEWLAFSVGEAWGSIHANSLIGFGSLIDKQLSPELWTNVAVPALNFPLWIMMLAPGLVATGLCYHRHRRSKSAQP